MTLVGATALVSFADLDARGIDVVGQLPGGALTLVLPSFALADVRALLPTAFVIFLLVFLDSNSQGRSMSLRYGEPLRPERDLLAQGATNVTASLAGGFLFLGAALVGVLGLGLVPGMLLAVGLSMLALMHDAARPHIARLGVDPKHPEPFADLACNPDHLPIPGVLLLRVDSALFFPNASHVMHEVRVLGVGQEGLGIRRTLQRLT